MKKLVWPVFVSIPVLLNVLEGTFFYLVSFLYLATGLYLNRGSFAFFKKWRFWVFVLVVIFIYPLIMPGKDISLLGIPLLSRRYLFESVKIAVTGLVMFTWIFVLTSYTTPQDVAGFFARLGMRDIGVYVTIALNLVPIVVKSIETTYLAMRIRGGFRWSPKRLRLFVITVFRNVILLAESLTIAISLEGFEGCCS